MQILQTSNKPVMMFQRPNVTYSYTVLAPQCHKVYQILGRLTLLLPSRFGSVASHSNRQLDVTTTAEPPPQRNP